MSNRTDKSPLSSPFSLGLASREPRSCPVRISLAIFFVLVLLMTFGCSARRGKIDMDRTSKYTASFSMEKSVETWMEECSAIIGSPVREEDSRIVSIKRDRDVFRVLAYLNGQVRIVTMSNNYNVTLAVTLAIDEDWTAEELFAAEDRLIVLIKDNSEGLWDQKYALCFFDVEGREISAQVDLPELKGKAILGTDYDGERGIAVLTDSEIQVFDLTDGSTYMVESPRPSMYQSLLLQKDGRILILSVNEKETFSLITQSYVQDTILSQKEITGLDRYNRYETKLIRPAESDHIGFYLETPIHVFAYNEKDDCLELCANKYTEGFYSDFPLISSGSKTFDGFGYLGFSDGIIPDEDNENCGFFTMTVVPKSENITTIRIGLCCDNPIRLNYYVGLFKKKYPEFEIDLIDYFTESDTGADPIIRLNADLLSGKGPDIICVSTENVYRYENAGVLLDLNEAIKNDASFDSGLLLPNVWGGGENDSSFRFLTPFFGIDGWMGKSELISRIETYDLDELSAFFKNLPEDTHIIRHDTAQILFEELFPFYRQEMMCSDSGFVRLDREDLLRLICFCEEFGKLPYSDSTPIATQFRQDQVLLLRERILNYEYYLSFAEYFGGDVSYTGAPGVPDGRPIIESDQYYGISAETQNPEAAWRFLAFLLSPDIQDRFASEVYSGGRMPVLRSAMDEMIRIGYERYMNGNSMRKNLYSDAEAESEKQRMEDMIQSMIDGREFDRDPVPRPTAFPFLEKNIAQDFMDLLLSAKLVPPPNLDTDRIVFEELEAYFSGQKSKEECVDIIKNRLETYWKENR